MRHDNRRLKIKDLKNVFTKLYNITIYYFITRLNFTTRQVVVNAWETDSTMNKYSANEWVRIERFYILYSKFYSFESKASEIRFIQPTVRKNDCETDIPSCV